MTNMVEIEIGVLRGQCLDRRIDDPKQLRREVTAWERSEMPPAPASNGCSQQTRPAPKWAAPIRPLPTSHNHCAKVLVWFYEGSVSLAAKEGRDIENSLLDRIAHSGEAAVRIEAPRSMARIFRNRLCRRPFGVADHGAQRRTP
jgi:hypothetical protein